MKVGVGLGSGGECAEPPENWPGCQAVPRPSQSHLLPSSRQPMREGGRQTASSQRSHQRYESDLPQDPSALTNKPRSPSPSFRLHRKEAEEMREAETHEGSADFPGATWGPIFCLMDHTSRWKQSSLRGLLSALSEQFAKGKRLFA